MKKICNDCELPKELVDFWKCSKNPDGLQYKCKTCLKSINSAWAKDHINRIKELNKNYHLINKEKRAQQIKEWNQKNVGKRRQYSSNYRAKYPDKIEAYKQSDAGITSRKRYKKSWLKKYPEKNRAKASLDKAIRLKRLPKWADRGKIKEMYLNCPPGMVVDHIIPLRGKNISGLHIHTNLQYLTSVENSKKGNKYEPLLG